MHARATASPAAKKTIEEETLSYEQLGNKVIISLLLPISSSFDRVWTLPAYKPGSVESDVVMVIPLGAWSPTLSSSLPAAS